jgi:6-phosphogluconate dehydrogenase
MVPAAFVDATVDALAPLLAAGDIVIDGGNSYYRDDIARADRLAPADINYVDVGTSGGMFGLDRGYCLMIGGDTPVVGGLAPIFSSLAPGRDAAPRTPGRHDDGSTAEEGYLHCGPTGAGHFVKMVHNGIEYGLMEAYAEGFELLSAKQEFGLDLHQVAEVWRNGSVVRSWLLDLGAQALLEDPGLEKLEAYVDDSGEGRWTVQESVELAVPAPVITLALQARFRSRQDQPFGGRLLAALRNQFGGHAVKER